jgi:muramoyltetrapeptide carboxypeptidase LdcA involved in peptidoglycan recycling
MMTRFLSLLYAILGGLLVAGGTLYCGQCYLQDVPAYLPQPRKASIGSKRRKGVKKKTKDAGLSMDQFRLCRVTPAPVEGHSPVDTTQRTALQVDYQCAGPLYEAFSDQMEDLVLELYTNSTQTSNQTSNPHKKHKKWGHRKRLVPAADRPRSILMLGNSHTRQMVSTLLCQYADQIRSHRVLFSVPNLTQVQEIVLDHNVTIYAATNCPLVYSTNWHKLLEQHALHKPLTSLDAIVLGRFNSYSESRGTNFVNFTKSYQEQYPEFDLDFEHVPGPTVHDVAQVYDGPIIWVSMFASYGRRSHDNATAMIQQLLSFDQEGRRTRRGNLRSIHGRMFIEQLLDKQRTRNHTKLPKKVQECATDTRRTVDTCVTNTSSYRYRNGHRCTGARGGHADLIAWEVVEALHDLLKE